MEQKKLKDLVKEISDEDIIKIVTELGSDQYIDKPDYIQFKTICHNADCGDASMKLYYYKNNKVFHCYTDCGCNFNLIELFKKRYDVLDYKYDFYKDIVCKLPIENNRLSRHEILANNFKYKYENPYSNFNPNPPQVNYNHYDPSLLNLFINYEVPEWIQDGISKEMLQYYNIRYDIPSNKVIIPHYDDKGFLIGIRGRDLNPDAKNKYMPIVIGDKVLNHALGYNLYGLNFIKGNLQKYGMAIVAEGEKSTLQYGSMFGANKNLCVATCGSSISSYQVELLLKNNVKKILIAFDKEGDTYEEKQNYYQKLKNFCLKYKNKVQMGFIWDNKDLLDLKDSPFDKGKETFLQLYKTAIWL